MLQPYKIELIQEGGPYKIEFREKVELSLTEVNEDSILITGLAVSNKVNTRYMQFTEEALDIATQSKNWQGAKTLVDHEYRSFDIVGQVKSFDRVSEGIAFGIDINPHHPSKVHIQVRRGDIDAVSVGGEANSITCTVCGEEAVNCNHMLGNKYDGEIAKAKINDFYLKELSLTGFPADIDAKISGFHAVVQSLNKIKSDRIEKLQNSSIVQTDTTESSERFINTDNKDKGDLKMSAEEIKSEVVENKQQEDFEKKLEVLQSALEKYSKENEELKKVTDTQSTYIEQKKAEEREGKISTIMKKSDMKRESLDEFSDEELDSSLKVLSTVKVPEEDANIIQPSQTVVGKPIVEQSKMEKGKALTRELFGFPDPSKSAVKKVQQTKRKPVYDISEIVIGEKGE